MKPQLSVNSWVERKKKDGTTARLYDFWILVRGALQKLPRWSVMHSAARWIE